MFALAAAEPQRSDGRGGVLQQPVPKFRVAPRVRDHPCAVARPDLGLVGVDQEIQRRGIDIALVGQQSLERADPQLQRREFAALVVVEMVVLRMGVVIGPGAIL